MGYTPKKASSRLPHLLTLSPSVSLHQTMLDQTFTELPNPMIYAGTANVDNDCLYYGQAMKANDRNNFRKAMSVITSKIQGCSSQHPTYGSLSATYQSLAKAIAFAESGTARLFPESSCQTTHSTSTVTVNTSRRTRPFPTLWRYTFCNRRRFAFLQAYTILINEVTI
jgi:hypothetical protein